VRLQSSGTVSPTKKKSITTHSAVARDGGNGKRNGNSGQSSVSYNGRGRRGVEERGPSTGGSGGGGGPQRDAAAVGPGEPTQQQRRHGDWRGRREDSSSDPI